ncbi:hypothetical protein AB0G29_35065 [Streptomyces parvus]|uniref:hypothetical protein n=1 Tax=Streptomyces parvus TaxID=66428 RepID=UPI0033C42639
MSGRRKTATVRVLDLVLRQHGQLCVCAGACGVEHTSGKCLAHGTEKQPMLVAPYPLPLTEHETAWAPVSELRRQALDEAQLGLFDVEAAAGGGR